MKGATHNAIRKEITQARSADAQSPKRAASRTQTIDGIKIAVSTPKHVRPGRTIKGGMETTVKINLHEHPYGVRLDIDGTPVRMLINGRYATFSIEG